jgi:lysophospholipase L1-like esterase
MRLNIRLITLVAATVTSALAAKNSSIYQCKKGDIECINSQVDTCKSELKKCMQSKSAKCVQIRQNCDLIIKLSEEEYKKKDKCNKKSYTFEPVEGNVKIIGRANYQDGYLWVGLTDAGIEYEFNGKATSINVTADNTAFSEETPARIIIYADGAEYLDTVITEKVTDFKVTFKNGGPHVVRFMKVSEAERGSIRINEIKCDSKKIKPTADLPKKIEFIGDSITSAYGVDGSLSETFTTRTQDGTKSYAYRTAKKFNADYSIVSYSGFAILSCMSFDGGRTPNSTVPPIYDRLGFSFAPNVFDDGTYELQAATWDYRRFIPDLVVINLGTNDSSYFDTIDPSKVPSEIEAFIQAYEDFIIDLRNYYPKAEILCTVGIMGDQSFQYIEQAVSNYKANNNDTHVRTFKFSEQNVEKNGLGTDVNQTDRKSVV